MGELFEGECSLQDGEQRLVEVSEIAGNEIKQRVSGYGWIKTVSFERGLFLISYNPERSKTCALYKIWIY